MNEINPEITYENLFFREKEETLAIIIDLVKVDTQKSVAEELLTRLRKILDSYQEQPQLLGPCCEELLSPVRSQLAFLVANEDTAISVRFCLLSLSTQHILTSPF